MGRRFYACLSVLAAAAMLLWPAVWNGYPIVFADTGTYLSQAIHRYAGWDRPGTLIGNGPFILTKYVLGDVVEVRKNPNYWNATHVHLNGIRFFPTSDINAEERMFRNGLLHITYTLPPLKTPAYRDSKSPDLRIMPVFGHYFYTFNVRKPPLDDPRIRLALALAIDRQALVDHVVKGGQTPAFALTPPSAQYQSSAQLTENITEAQRLLAEAGHPNGQGLPPIELTYNTSDAHRAIAEVLQQQWKKNLGVDLRLVNVPAPEWLDRRRTANFQLIRAGWYGDYLDPSTFLELFRSGSEEEQSGWSNPAYDHYLDDAANETDPAKRLEDFQQAEALLLKEAPMIPLYYYTTIQLIRPEVRGYENNPLDQHPYDAIYFDPSATTPEPQP
jgi:oligopeptide transport system substrate-binding protein